MIKNLNEHQPHIVINDNNQVHIVPLVLIRNIANGSVKADNELVPLIAKALLDNIE